MPTLEELEKITSICSVLSKAPFYQKLGPGGTLAIWLTAMEMDLPPMACLNGGLYTFDGKIQVSSILMNALIVKSGHRTEILRLDEQACEILFWRSDRPEGKNTFTYRYTIHDATKAKLITKDNWQKNLRDMLFCRCLMGGGKKFMPDVFMSIASFYEDEPNEISSKDEEENIIENNPQPSLNELSSFKERYQIGYDGPYESFINTLSAKLNKTREEVIISAQMNEEGFLESFEKWNSRKKKEVTEEEKSEFPKETEIEQG